MSITAFRSQWKPKGQEQALQYPGYTLESKRAENWIFIIEIL